MSKYNSDEKQFKQIENENNTLNNENLDSYVKNCYNKIQSFYGVFYDNYTTTKTMLIWRIPFFAFFLFVIFYLAPLTYSGSKNILIALVPVVVISFMNFGIFILTRQKKYDMFFYKHNGKIVTVYWDRHKKKNIIINFGDIKLTYYIKYKIWEKSTETLANRKLYFNHLKNNLVVKNKKDGIKYIISYNKLYTKRYAETILKLQNDEPISIEYRAPQNSEKVKKHYNTINQLIAMHIDFIEINKERFVELPKSLIDYCEKNNITPPEENEYLHYID